jgi:methenyltetrahydrofolate cyclohydrolase
MLITMNIEEFLNTLSSEQPTPGGGSVAGLANCLSASLLQMFCKISQKTAQDDEKELFTKLAAETKDIFDKVKLLIDEDAKAFDNVINAFKLPKITDQEKDIRKQKIQDAFYEAALVPLDNIRYSVELLDVLSEVEGKGSINAMSDYKCAIYMAKAAYQCALENVLINLESLKDESKKNQILAELKILERTL